MDGERPVRVVADCSTGTAIATPLSDAQWAEHRQAEADGEARARVVAEQQSAEDEQIRALVDAHPDPLVKLLARRAGLA